MADLPILFSAPMVRAILREIAEPGTGKTQTRRVIEPYEPKAGSRPASDRLVIGKTLVDNQLAIPTRGFLPKYVVRDRLWVREAWRSYHRYDAKPPRDLKPSATIYYEAGEIGEDEISVMRGKLRPSMHLPRWASRITLEVTGVKVERLQDCSEADAIAEGAPLDPDHVDRTQDGSNPHMVRVNAWTQISPLAWYHRLWDDINKPGAWDKNPWVAAYTFRPILANIDQLTEAA